MPMAWAALGAYNLKLTLSTLVEGLTFKKKKNTSFGQNQGLVWSSNLSLWGNQLLKRKNTSFGQNQDLVWSSNSSIWGNQLLKRKNTSFGQNQGLVWSSDSSLWGNQLLKRKNTSFGHNLDVVWPSDSTSERSYPLIVGLIPRLNGIPSLSSDPQYLGN